MPFEHAQLPVSLALLLIVFAVIVVATRLYFKAGAARAETLTAQPSRTSAHFDPPLPLGNVRNWAYQLQDLDIAATARSSFDLIVIDPSEDGDDASALSAAQIGLLKQKPGGGRRIVLAYVSIGEAESYRSYWQPAWFSNAKNFKPPAWLLAENPDWEDNYAVKFWRKDWQRIMFGTQRSSLDKVIAQGFDGVYLDKCDVYEDLQRRHKAVAASRSNLEGDMITFVERLSRYVKSKRAGFYVVMQNAEGLLGHARVRLVLDAVAKEELVFGQDGGERRNIDDDYQYSRHQLDLAKTDGLPVFVVEYLTNSAKIAEIQKITAEQGFVLYIAHVDRELAQLNNNDPAQMV